MSNQLVSKEDNVTLIKEKVKKMMASGFRGIVLVATAESNVVAALIKRFSGLPANQIITLGTMLATSYFQVEIAKLFKISPKMYTDILLAIMQKMSFLYGVEPFLEANQF